MDKPESVFLPALGKVVELGALDSFNWATLNGWAAFAGSKRFRETVTPSITENDPAAQAEAVAKRLEQEKEDLKLIRFTDEQAAKDYPYLFALVSVRLWAMAEAAAREALTEAVKTPSGPPDRSKLLKLKGPIGQFLGADADTQAELIADALWHAPEGRFRGVQRFDAALEQVGLGGDLPSAISEILGELAEVRHCVVHRGGLVDRRFLEACPWIEAKVGSHVPASIGRYWLHRTATYWYLLELVRRWAEWRQIATFSQAVAQMLSAVLNELKHEWDGKKRVVIA